MQAKNRLIAFLGIPFTTLLSVVFGLFLISFPIGIFVVFESDIGEEINYEFPLSKLDVLRETVLADIPIDVSIGDAFVVIWALYAVVFVIATMGPKQGFLKSFSPIIQLGRLDARKNYMLGATKWFSVLVLVSALINYVQESFGVTTVAPLVENNLVQFLYVTAAPLFEEFGFRVILIGVPLLALYSCRVSAGNVLGCLWNPGKLEIGNYKKAIVLIVAVGVLFGIAHVALGQSWSEGKFAQATAGGIILGWAYVRYGFATALLVHWATNYFIYAYANMVAQLNLISIQDAFAHSLMPSLELLLLASGVMSATIILADRLVSRRESGLEV